ncbi:hypothetical protein GQX74_001602 [Glossina fuscipes]|uniref:Uncharacterized protein n=1 Tax=Glossina palpalis gambiensis TaxID=67801 RepID=A0A1B0B7Q7_9MUSC|nr:hypothetical protein GQX74_001602 [Glossina fuscipes]
MSNFKTNSNMMVKITLMITAAANLNWCCSLKLSLKAYRMEMTKFQFELSGFRISGRCLLTISEPIHTYTHTKRPTNDERRHNNNKKTEGGQITSDTTMFVQQFMTLVKCAVIQIL